MLFSAVLESGLKKLHVKGCGDWGGIDGMDMFIGISHFQVSNLLLELSFIVSFNYFWGRFKLKYVKGYGINDYYLSSNVMAMNSLKEMCYQREKQQSHQTIK